MPEETENTQPPVPEAEQTVKPSGVSMRGFATMRLKDPARQRAISARGGANVPAGKRKFSTDPELAKAAGAIGGSRKRRASNDQRQ